jgi:hypothetical protein
MEPFVGSYKSEIVFGFSCRKRHETAHLAFYDALLTLFSFQGTAFNSFAWSITEVYNSIFICLCQHYYSFQLLPPLAATFIDYHDFFIMSNVIFLLIHIFIDKSLAGISIYQMN